MSVRIDVSDGFVNADIRVDRDGYTTSTLELIREAVEAVGRVLDIPMTVVRTDG